MRERVVKRTHSRTSTNRGEPVSTARLKTVTALRIVPVIVIDDADRAADLGRALMAGGLPMAEVTLRTPAALDAIRAMAQVEGLLVGAGTVLSPDHARAAVKVGADFLVSPGLDDATAATARDLDVPLLPGVATATEIQHAWTGGFRLVKFFPANIAGGPAALRAMGSVFADMAFMPTGGVTLDTLPDYLALPNVTACGGSWIAPADLIREGNFAEITARAAAAVATAAKLEA